MRSGKIQTQGDIKGDCWELIYSSLLAAATNSITISNLNGDADKEYKLIIRWVNGHSTWELLGVRPNNDTGSNYGNQYVRGVSTTSSAARDTSANQIYLSRGGSNTTEKHLTKLVLYAKSGYLRTGILSIIEGISTTIVGYLYLNGVVWNNTADNITSLVILSGNANGIGIGTSIELYKKSDKV